jgi:hypothetical protein
MSIIFSPYEKELNMSDNDSVKLYKKGNEKVPTKFSGETNGFRLFIHDVASCATECQWKNILTFNVNGVDLTLIKDYECIPMSTVIAK